MMNIPTKGNFKDEFFFVPPLFLRFFWMVSKDESTSALFSAEVWLLSSLLGAGIERRRRELSV
jgi:hypothetical protein